MASRPERHRPPAADPEKINARRKPRSTPGRRYLGGLSASGADHGFSSCRHASRRGSASAQWTKRISDLRCSRRPASGNATTSWANYRDNTESQQRHKRCSSRQHKIFSRITPTCTSASTPSGASSFPSKIPASGVAISASPYTAPVSTFPPAFWYPTPPLYTVPYLIGDDLDTAKLILAQRGLQVGRITQQGSNQPADTVVQTNPSANTVVPPGSPVDLIIAKR